MSSQMPCPSIASLMAAKCSRNFMTRSLAGRRPLRFSTAAMPAHGDRVERHPAGGVRLLQRVARWQVGAVDRADVVEPEEAALEQVVALGVLPVDPPGEVDQELVEDAAQEVQVAAAVDGEHLQRRPRLHRRVDVGEVPLIGGQRPVRVLEPFPAQQDQLVFGERRVKVGQGHTMERQVPGGEPRVFPLVRHGQDVEGVEVAPPGVAPGVAGRRAGAAGWGPRRASGPRRSSRTACSTACRKRPAA